MGVNLKNGGKTHIVGTNYGLKVKLGMLNTESSVQNGDNGSFDKN